MQFYHTVNSGMPQQPIFEIFGSGLRKIPTPTRRPPHHPPCPRPPTTYCPRSPTTLCHRPPTTTRPRPPTRPRRSTAPCPRPPTPTKKSKYNQS